MAPGPYDDIEPRFGRESLFRKKLNQLRSTGHIANIPEVDSYTRSKEIEKSTYLENVASTLAKADPQELDRITLLDSLTQLYNHNTIMRIMKDEAKRAKRYKFHTALLMISVDALQEINLKHGAFASDSILKGVGNFLMGTIRDVDIPARFDAEHFLIVCPQTDVSGASVLAERLRGKICTERISDAGQNWTITVSIGIAAFPTHGVKEEDLINQAQNAMAEAETAGGNSFIVAPNSAQ